MRAAFLLLVLSVGCSSSGTAERPATPTPSALPSVAATPTPTQALVEVRYRLVRHTTDAATDDFATVVDRTLHDPRGWQRAGFRLVRDNHAPYAVLLAEPDEAQAKCLPLDVRRKYSCQNGPVVVLNADRWRRASEKWTGTLAAYRQMLVNHEVGHLLGQHHPPSPSPPCPRPGRLALVMSQQSSELNGCLPNPWPLPAEIASAAEHVEPLAPLPTVTARLGTPTAGPSAWTLHAFC